ncbi:hypothetical protein AVEN_145594-1 [Araneus ventricosus]|uniref:Uncharacterized protein n=1 Tax=Araneus ventricosus TaxID=182803 RepID=A0A4Y2S2H3_ARAVE|nr:hypothetical protein AVEN_145594-1 [Araneus ventricosus]
MQDGSSVESGFEPGTLRLRDSRVALISKGCYRNSFNIFRARGDLVIRSRLRSQGVPGSNLYFTDDLPCLWALCEWVENPPAGVVRKFGKGGASSCVDLVI